MPKARPDHRAPGGRVGRRWGWMGWRFLGKQKLLGPDMYYMVEVLHNWSGLIS